MKHVDFCRLELQSGTDADSQIFTNPYTDSRIFHSSSEQSVNMVFAGIDIETTELLLADRLKERGAPVDAVCAHLLLMVGSRSLLFLFSAACPG